MNSLYMTIVYFLRFLFRFIQISGNMIRTGRANGGRQSREAARHRLDPDSDDHVSLREYEALLDADPVAD